ncbi:FAD-dependent oxidoreductase [Ruania halotolerans]|uniref:FAD-dependent oxidoreductase n=1 Tax=Ruania halotolerans TaxID=2897773 RepID=UPI001E3D8344|nr:FAD-dependent oxidoreductase [Ruania halotolerans]UFU05514.1 FAD-dependent oxidoreductase [Ruania halotolerans]
MPDSDVAALTRRYDVAVVGAGLTGLSTAVQLARHGIRVIVLEARAIGAGTTGGSTAKISLLQGTRLSTIAAKHRTDTVAQYVAGNGAGMDWLLDFCRSHGVAHQRPAAATYAGAPTDVADVEREQEVCESVGLPVSWRATDDVRFPFHGAVVLEDQAQIDPIELLTALADAAREAGVEIVTGARVTAFGDSGAAPVVTTRGAVQAERVVLATGIPVADRGGFFARLIPERSYGVALHTEGQQQMDMYLSAGSPTRSLRTTPDEDGHRILLGGNSHPVGKAVSERAQVRDLTAWAGEHFPEATVTHEWSAQDYHPIDELPYVGPLLPGSDRVLVATGYAKWGLTNACAAATLLTAHLEQAELPDWSPAFASWSTHEIRGGGAALAHNAHAAANMVGARAGGYARLAGEPEEGAGIVGRDGARLVARARVDGHTYQLSADCPHLGGVLSWNDAECTWDCSLHGSRFTAAGELLEGPATTGMSAVGSATAPEADQ